MAVVTATAITAYSSYKAADKAASATKKGLNQSAQMAQDSRENAIRLYQQGSDNANLGLQSAFNFYKQAAQSPYQPFIKANAAAQGVIGQGAQQANNAILGLPVDMSFAAPQSVNPDLSMLQNAQLPQANVQMQEQPMVGPVQLGAGGLSGNSARTLLNTRMRGRVQ